jgi:hypothetical protein
VDIYTVENPDEKLKNLEIPTTHDPNSKPKPNRKS